MNNYEIKETKTLKDVEICIRWTCIQFNLSQSVTDLAIMLARRSVKELEFNTEQIILYVLSVLLISTRFYDIHVEKIFWNYLYYDRIDKTLIEKCINYILSFFPHGASDLYLDQFISPQLIENKKTIEKKITNHISTKSTKNTSSILNPDFNSSYFHPLEFIENFTMKNFKNEQFKKETKQPKNQFECSICDKLRKYDYENVLDFNMFCSDECKKNFMIFIDEYYLL